VSTADRLYTPEVLMLATSLAALPMDEGLDWRGSARSVACGSSLELGLALDENRLISRIGVRAQACAIGQASAAVFAAAAPGLARADVAAALARIREWLDNEAQSLPDWPGLAAIAPARGYQARHGAILLAWHAALDALP